MSEDRPLYEVLDELAAELSEFAPPTIAQIADRMRTLSSEMMALGTDMELTRNRPIVWRGVALYAGAARLQEWVHEIEGAQG